VIAKSLSSSRFDNEYECDKRVSRNDVAEADQSPRHKFENSTQGAYAHQHLVVGVLQSLPSWPTRLKHQSQKNVRRSTGRLQLLKFN